MTIQARKSDESDTLTISLDGSFDYSLLKEFRNSYTAEETVYSKYVIDMRNVDMMDSSALGMLLNMKKTLNKEKDEIRIVNCRATLKRILLIARFDKKFDIE